MGHTINHCSKDRNLKVTNLTICHIEGMPHLNHRDTLDNLNPWLVETGKSHLYIPHSTCPVQIPYMDSPQYTGHTVKCCSLFPRYHIHRLKQNNQKILCIENYETCKPSHLLIIVLQREKSQSKTLKLRFKKQMC